MDAVYQDLSGKVVLITGGANGIGASMVESFCQQGAKVYFCDLDEAAGKKTCPIPQWSCWISKAES